MRSLAGRSMTWHNVQVNGPEDKKRPRSPGWGRSVPLAFREAAEGDQAY
jgi:hypothetical protein